MRKYKKCWSNNVFHFLDAQLAYYSISVIDVIEDMTQDK